MISINKWLLSILLLMVIVGGAQAAEREWDDGSVWSITYAETKPGKFNDYMSDLNKVWRAFIEAEAKDGDILSWHVLQVPTPADGAPNVIFLVEYKNWAAFDKGTDYFDGLAEKILGSAEMANTASIDREALRTLRGGLTAQEVVLR